MPKQDQMADMLDEIEGRKQPEPKDQAKVKVNTGPTPPQVGETEEPEPESRGPDPSDLAPAGYPNPLGIQLTRCHLPAEFVDDRSQMVRYVGRFFRQPDIAKITPTKNEQALYQTYLKMINTTRKRKVASRMFAAAVRCIVAGKPMDVPSEVSLDQLAI